MQQQEIVVVGCGPVGCAAALLLAKEGGFTNIKIYEGRSCIPNDPEETYPIGLNPRSFHCLSRIDPGLAQRVKDNSLLVKAWNIFGGERMVANLKSGTARAVLLLCCSAVLL